MFEIGISLREARGRRRIEFAQAEQATKIRVKYLRALEKERFDTLPSETYVKGFLRTYAEYLGLDGQLYVDEFNSRFVAGDDGARRAARRVSPPPREHRLQRNAVLLAAGAIVVVTVVVLSAWTALGGKGHETAPPAKKPVVSHAAPAPAAGYLQISAAKGPSKVIVNRASSGGRILFEGTLERGETQAFSGTRFWLNVGAPENLVVTVGGKRVHLGGYRPWVVTVTSSGWRSHPA